MPKVYGDKHNGFMKRYFESSIPHILNNDRIVFPINKQGYLVACTLYVKILPKLEKGIEIVGFLNDLQ